MLFSRIRSEKIFLGITILCLIPIWAFASVDDAQLRAEVEAFQASLKQAFDADDRASVLSHFEHGELILPSDSDFRRLRSMNFWEKPIKNISVGPDGVMEVQFVMDPESEQPAMTVTLSFIRDSNGRLLVKSEATPEELEEARLAKRKADQETAVQEKKRAEMKKFIHEFGPTPEYPLKEVLVSFLAENEPGFHAQMEKGTVAVFGLGEVHVGDRALFVTVLAEREDDDSKRLRKLDYGLLPFRRIDGTWVLSEEDMRMGDQEIQDTFFSASQKPKFVRRSGLSLEDFPNFLSFSWTDQRERFQAAEKAGDPEGCARIFEEIMIGYHVMMGEEVLKELGRPGREVKSVRMVKQEEQGGEMILHFEADTDDGKQKQAYRLVEEGNGWVILDEYEEPSKVTMANVRMLASSVEAYAIDEGSYPQVEGIEQLRAILEPSYIRNMPVKDSWGTPLFYRSEDGKSYRIVSAGSDREIDPESWSQKGDFVDMAEDLVFENGTFVRAWKVN